MSATVPVFIATEGQKVFGEPFRFGQPLVFHSHGAGHQPDAAQQGWASPGEHHAKSKAGAGRRSSSTHATPAAPSQATAAAAGWPGSACYYLGTLTQALSASIAQQLVQLQGSLGIAGAGPPSSGLQPFKGQAGPAWFKAASPHRLGQQQSPLGGGLPGAPQTGDATGGGRYQQDDGTTPGPGAYTLPDSWGRQGPAFTIAPSRHSPGALDPTTTTPGAPADPRAAAREAARARAAQQRSRSPGPGDYDVARVGAGGGPAFTMGGRPRSPCIATEGPGPGEYQQLAAAGQGPAFTIAARPAGAAAQRDQDSPGPGSYSTDVVRTGQTGPAFTMAGRPGGPSAARGGSPGPADYQRQEYQPTGPAFTIPKRRDPPPRGSAGSPAPGDYAPDVAGWKGSGPAYSFGTAPPPSRGMDAGALSPGPGEYYTPAAPAGPAFSLGSRPSKPRKGDQGVQPGPGEYYQPLDATGPAFTMLGRGSPGPGALSAAPTPGPGAYPKAAAAADAMLPDAPAFTIGVRYGSTGEGKRTASPGPGQYNPAEVDAASTPAWTMGAKPKPTEANSRSSSPGPGAYAVQPSCPGGPAFTIGVRPRDPTPQEQGNGRYSPGPGDYDLEGGVTSGTKAAPAWTMGTRHEAAAAEEDLPGPGAYHVDSPTPSGPAFTMGGRPSSSTAEADRNPSPGPGEYWPPLDAVQSTPNQGPAFTIGTRLPDAGDKGRADSPGPGQYSTAAAQGAVLPAAPAFTIGQRPAATDYNGDAEGSGLGPGAYQLPPAPHAGPAFSISGRWSTPAEGDSAAARPSSPGPGAYDVTTATNAMEGKAPAWTLGQRHAPPGAAARCNSPAPGDYALPSLPAGAAFTIGTRSTPGPTAVDQELQPGPGAYDPMDPNLAPGAAFTIGTRHGSSADAGRGTDSPGPGEYDTAAAAAAVLPAGPAFTIAGRLEGGNSTGADGSSSPGPGEYDSSGGAFGSDAPAFSIRGKAPGPTADEGDPIPGPGAYQLPTVGTGPSFTLGTKPAPPRDGPSSPGPGEYPLPSTLSGPAFTLGTRIDVKQAEVDGPAPGDYDVHHTEPGGPAFTIGARPSQPPRAPLAEPGPGEYHREGTEPGAPAAPAFTLQGKHSRGQTLKEQLLGPLAVEDPTPGPGEHQQLSSSIPGPSFSFAPPAAKAGKPTLQQLQQQLSRLLATHAKLQQQGQVKQRSRGRDAASEAAAWAGLPSHDGPGSRGSSRQGRGLKATAANNRRTAGKVGATRHPLGPAGIRDTPAPGDYDNSSSSATWGLRGPAYTLPGRTTETLGALRSSSEQNPGPGRYQDMQDFPHPLGKVISGVKPILKQHGGTDMFGSSRGGTATAVYAADVGRARSLTNTGTTLGSSSTRRRVSWADEC